MKTALMLVATWVFFGACVVALFRPQVVPFEALLWGGLILIIAWWVHDVMHEREGKGRYADRTRTVIR